MAGWQGSPFAREWTCVHHDNSFLSTDRYTDTCMPCVSYLQLRPGWPGGVHPALVRLGRACLATNASERPSFDAIAKVLTKIETNVRNELREQQQQPHNDL